MRIEDEILYRVERIDINDDGSFIIPDSITGIGRNAFYNRRELKTITIPDSITSIGDWAFGYCTELTNVMIGNNVASIGNYAFDGCGKLTSITLSDSIKSIGGYAFHNCDSLVSKKSIYKAFRMTKDGKLKCRDKIYTPDKWHTVRGNLYLCGNGIHYCDNLFEIFNHYFGKLDDEIAIYECEIKGEDLQEYGSSKHCCKWLKPVKRLSGEEITAILSGRE